MTCCVVLQVSCDQWWKFRPRRPILYRKTCGLAVCDSSRAQHIDKGSDRTTRLSEPSDVAVVAVTATHFRWLPAFRRSIHRPHTRGQLPIRGTATWQRVCMLFRTRRAWVSIDGNRQWGRNLVSFFGALVAVLLVLNSHLKPSPSSWRLRTPPHGPGRGKW
jgi:hypothetical protein